MTTPNRLITIHALLHDAIQRIPEDTPGIQYVRHAFRLVQNEYNDRQARKERINNALRDLNKELEALVEQVPVTGADINEPTVKQYPDAAHAQNMLAAVDALLGIPE